MKLRALLTAAVAMLLVVSAATAAPPPGKGKNKGTTTTSAQTTACKAHSSIVLTGTLAADGAAAPSSLSVNVTGGNKAGRAYKGTTPVAVAVTTSTKVVKGTDGAKAKAESLKSGDKVNIQAKCAATLTATRVTVQGTGA